MGPGRSSGQAGLARARGKGSYPGRYVNQASSREWLAGSGAGTQLVVTTGSYADYEGPDYLLARVSPYSVGSSQVQA